MDFRQGGAGYASIFVDATADRRNEWWALIQREVTTLDLALLEKPGWAVRIGARIRVSHAPRRVNLQVQTQRTTDYHSHLMEFDIAEADEWHTISYTTRGVEAWAGDTLIAHMALMDWGDSKYRVDVDFMTPDLVDTATAPPDHGPAVPYHPSIADAGAFSHAVETRSGDVLRWDLRAFSGQRSAGSGLLELTTRSIEGTGLLRHRRPAQSAADHRLASGSRARRQNAADDLAAGSAAIDRRQNGRDGHPYAGRSEGFVRGSGGSALFDGESPVG
ncbi:MAG TPA: hypothetical protein VNA04_04880 [Thermoanaerobaculia bacterium]|nr:hypothetical protein [Thermoanaerobaculia bacterium]